MAHLSHWEIKRGITSSLTLYNSGLRRYLSDYPERTLKEFYQVLDKWEADHVRQAIQLSSSRSYGTGITPGGLREATTYHILSNVSLFRDAELRKFALSQFQAPPSSVATSDILPSLSFPPEVPIPAGVLLLLVDSDSSLRSTGFLVSRLFSRTSLLRQPAINIVLTLFGRIASHATNSSPVLSISPLLETTLQNPELWRALPQVLACVNPASIKDDLTAKGTRMVLKRAILGNLAGVQCKHPLSSMRHSVLLLRVAS